MLSASPDREFLNIDSATSFRGGLIPLILGDGDSQWSAVKVAEAYSRIVKGTRVFATFLATDARPPALPSFNVARSAVTSGLALNYGGTAFNTRIPAALDKLTNRRAAHGLVLGAFSKTGTMVVPARTSASCGDRDPDHCSGKAFAIVLAAYDQHTPRLEVDTRTGRALNAMAIPRCAITIFVNLPQWNGGGVNAAADTAAQIIAVDGDRGVAQRLLETGRGGYCGR